MSHMATESIDVYHFTSWFEAGGNLRVLESAVNAEVSENCNMSNGQQGATPSVAKISEIAINTSLSYVQYMAFKHALFLSGQVRVMFFSEK